MFDANVDALTGDPAASWGVTYSLTEHAKVWSLAVDLDSAWVHAAGRKFPITVDPTIVTITDSEDDEWIQQNSSISSNSLSSNPPGRVSIFGGWAGPTQPRRRHRVTHDLVNPRPTVVGSRTSNYGRLHGVGRGLVVNVHAE